MSKLKVSHVAPRFERGTTYIGEDGSVTHFHPHSQVILHDYATEDWVLDQITGDIELDDYLTKEEAEDVYSQISYGQFEPLNSHVDDLWYDTTVDSLKLCTEVTINDEGVTTSQVWADVSGVSSEELDAYQELKDKGAPNGYVPLGAQGKISSQFLNASGFEIVGVYGENNPLPDPVTVADGTAFLCNSDGHVDQYLPGVTSGSGDTCLDIGDIYEHIPSTGTVNADQVIETQNRVFVHPGDLEDLEATFGEYLPLSGGSTSKMTGDIYMQSHRITGLTSERDHATDAVSYAAADTTYLRQDGNSEMDGELDMDDHRVVSLADPVDNKDAATKEYVDDSIALSQRLGRKFSFTSGGKTSTSYVPGDLFFTTENNVAYTLAFADARYVCFAFEDSDGMIWRTAKLGSVSLPSGHIIIEYQGRMMGWFNYEGGTAAMTDGSQTGSVVLPVTGWNSTTAQYVVTSGSNYELITQFWN